MPEIQDPQNLLPQIPGMNLETFQEPQTYEVLEKAPVKSDIPPGGFPLVKQIGFEGETATPGDQPAKMIRRGVLAQKMRNQPELTKDEIMKQEGYSLGDFGKKIRVKAIEDSEDLTDPYGDMSDEELGSRVLRRYPEYSDMINTAKLSRSGVFDQFFNEIAPREIPMTEFQKTLTLAARPLSGEAVRGRDIKKEFDGPEIDVDIKGIVKSTYNEKDKTFNLEKLGQIYMNLWTNAVGLPEDYLDYLQEKGGEVERKTLEQLGKRFLDQIQRADQLRTERLALPINIESLLLAKGYQTAGYPGLVAAGQRAAIEQGRFEAAKGPVTEEERAQTEAAGRSASLQLGALQTVQHENQSFNNILNILSQFDPGMQAQQRTDQPVNIIPYAKIARDLLNDNKNLGLILEYHKQQTLGQALIEAAPGAAVTIPRMGLAMAAGGAVAGPVLGPILGIQSDVAVSNLDRPLSDQAAAQVISLVMLGTGIGAGAARNVLAAKGLLVPPRLAVESLAGAGGNVLATSVLDPNATKANLTAQGIIGAAFPFILSRMPGWNRGLAGPKEKVVDVSKEQFVANFIKGIKGEKIEDIVNTLAASGIDVPQHLRVSSQRDRLARFALEAVWRNRPEIQQKYGKLENLQYDQELALQMGQDPSRVYGKPLLLLPESSIRGLLPEPTYGVRSEDAQGNVTYIPATPAEAEIHLENLRKFAKTKAYKDLSDSQRAVVNDEMFRINMLLNGGMPESGLFPPNPRSEISKPGAFDMPESSLVTQIKGLLGPIQPRSPVEMATVEAPTGAEPLPGYSTRYGKPVGGSRTTGVYFVEELEGFPPEIRPSDPGEQLESVKIRKIPVRKQPSQKAIKEETRRELMREAEGGEVIELGEKPPAPKALPGEAYVPGESTAPSAPAPAMIRLGPNFLNQLRERVIANWGGPEGLLATYTDEGIKRILGLPQEASLNVLLQSGAIERREGGYVFNQDLQRTAAKMGRAVNVPEEGTATVIETPKPPPEIEAKTIDLAPVDAEGNVDLTETTPTNLSSETAPVPGSNLYRQAVKTFLARRDAKQKRAATRKAEQERLKELADIELDPKNPLVAALDGLTVEELETELAALGVDTVKAAGDPTTLKKLWVKAQRDYRPNLRNDPFEEILASVARNGLRKLNISIDEARQLILDTEESIRAPREGKDEQYLAAWDKLSTLSANELDALKGYTNRSLPMEDIPARPEMIGEGLAGTMNRIEARRVIRAATSSMLADAGEEQLRKLGRTLGVEIDEAVFKPEDLAVDLVNIAAGMKRLGVLTAGEAKAIVESYLEAPSKGNRIVQKLTPGELLSIRKSQLTEEGYRRSKGSKANLEDAAADTQDPQKLADAYNRLTYNERAASTLSAMGTSEERETAIAKEAREAQVLRAERESTPAKTISELDVADRLARLQSAAGKMLATPQAITQNALGTLGSWISTATENAKTRLARTMSGGEVPVESTLRPKESILATFADPTRPNILIRPPGGRSEGATVIMNRAAAVMAKKIFETVFPAGRYSIVNSSAEETYYYPKLAAEASREALSHPEGSVERTQWEAMADIYEVAYAMGKTVSMINIGPEGITPELYKVLRRHEYVHQEQFKVARDISTSQAVQEGMAGTGKRIYMLTNPRWFAQHPLVGKILENGQLARHYHPEFWAAEAAAYAADGGAYLGLTKSEAAQFLNDYKLHLAAKYGNVIDGLFEKVNPKIKKLIADEAVKEAKLYPCGKI